MTRLVVFGLFLSLAGCAGPKNMAINQSVLPTLKGKTLSLVAHESPSFVAMTSGKGMFAVVGVGAAVAAGNQMVKDDEIMDPAENISKLLADNLVTRYGLSNKGIASDKADSTDLADILALAGESDYVLDVETNGWSFIYDGFNFSDYLVGYSVKMQLIDVANTTPVVQGFCAYDTKTAGKQLVSYETLQENNAAYIKQALDDAKTFCVDKFKKELF